MIYSHTLALKSHYPWTSSPLISSAPMRLIATSPLAVAVSRAGGLGFLGIGTDASTFSSLLNESIAAVQTSPIPNTPRDILPIGVGFICWGADLSMALSVIRTATLKPVAAWLFAPQKSNDLVAWTEGIRKASNGKTKIWIQVSTVAMALFVAKACKPDVLVIQGSDAGGHGLAQSSSIITLLPECADALASGEFGEIPLIATGGIVDGRGVAAALVLGASGVCLGTRFLASPEAAISEGYRNAVIQAKDGGVSTTRTTVYDRLRGTVGWPEAYNGRGVLNQSFRDHECGMSIENNKKLYEDAMKLGVQGWGDNGRMTTYASTGVVLIHSVIPAADITMEVLEQSRELVTRARSKL
ncbi:NPD-domain-containing protein [Stipitochalara longipes BDJ]|nr:NPD-domain-containing protein [Stipitochalara longipes BDJ]